MGGLKTAPTEYSRGVACCAQIFRFLKPIILVFLLLGCNLTTLKTATPVPSSSPPVNPLIISSATSEPATATRVALPITDATWILEGICFEGLVALDGQRLLIEDAVSLRLLFDMMNSNCEKAISPPAIDFANEILVIGVEVAQACDAAFEAHMSENGSLKLNFIQSGTCPYEVVALYAGTLSRSAGKVILDP